MKKALVCGAGGFIGSHLIKRLKTEGYDYVRGVDIKEPEFDKDFGTEKQICDNFQLLDLRSYENCKKVLSLYNDELFDDVYQLAADMGGAGYIFSGDHDADIMHNSAQINLNFADLHKHYKKIFYSSSACMYPEHNQLDPNNPNCEESSAYPANPDSEYGWEKLFSERLYLSYARNYNVDVHIARFHNIFGPHGSWNNGKEKAPAAICRKIAILPDEGGEIEVWGDGEQTRSFLYIDECLEGIRRLMDQSWHGPVNIGSEEIVTINQLVQYVADIAGKKVTIKHIDGPLGVRGRTSDNKLIQERLNWKPNYSLKDGLAHTYAWINEQVNIYK